MSSLPSLVAPRPRLPLKRAAVTACVAAVAAGASVVAVSAMDDAAAPSAAPSQIVQGSGARLATSFGSVSVDYVFRLIGADNPMGLTPPAGTVPIQVGVTVINTTDKPVPLTKLFATSPVAAETLFEPGSRTDGMLPARSAHRVLLRYSVRDGVALPQLLVRDPAAAQPARVELGKNADELKTLNVGTHKFEGGVH